MADIHIRLKLGAVYLVVVGIFILAAYELSFPLLFLRYNLWPCVVLLTLIFAAFGLGNLVVESIARTGTRRIPPAELVDRNVTRASLFSIGEEILLSLAAGLGIVAYAILAFNLLHLLQRRWVVPVLFALVVFGIIRARQLCTRDRLLDIGRQGNEGKPQQWTLPPVFRLGVLICLFTPLALSFFLALTPVHQSDAIRYHMAVPALYVEAGGYVHLPHSAFSNFPFTIEMLYTLALLLGSESAAKLIHWLFLVLLVGAVYALGRHVRRRNLGLLAAAVLANVPFIPIFSSWAFIEVGLAFYQFMIFYCLLRLLRCLAGSDPWGESNSPPDPAKRTRLVLHPSGWIILCATFAGLALGTKYTSLFPFALAVATLAVVIIKDRFGGWPGRKLPEEEKRPDQWQSLPNPVRQIVVLVALTALIASPWYVKNLAQVGNPVYPFARSVFPTPHWSSYNAEFYRYHAGMKGDLNQFWEKDSAGKLWDLLSLPYTLTVGRRVENDVSYFQSCRPKRLWPWNRDQGVRGGVYPFLRSGDGDRLRLVDFGRWEVGPLWLLLLPLLLTVKPRPWEIRILLLYGLLLFLFWAFTYRDNRFLTPVFAVLAVPAGFVLLTYSQQTRPIFAWFRVFLLIILFWNLLWLLRSVFTSYNPFPVITGRESTAGFLEQQRDTGGFIRAMREVNQIRTAEEKVLLVGEYRAYHCRPPYISADWFNTPVLIEWIREAGTLEATRERLRAEGVNCVLVNQGEIDKYWLYYLPHFLPVDEAREWMKRYRRASGHEAQQALVHALLERVSRSATWQTYNQLLQSEDLLEPIYEESYTEEESAKRPPLPARSKIGVYRLKD